MNPLSLDLEADSVDTLQSASSSESESVMILGGSCSVLSRGLVDDFELLVSIELFFFLLMSGELKNVLE